MAYFPQLEELDSFGYVVLDSVSRRYRGKEVVGLSSIGKESNRDQECVRGVSACGPRKTIV